MFGTVALSIGQLFYESWYPITSNLGLLIYTITLLVLMREIDKDIIKTAEFTAALNQVALKGNQISVLNDGTICGKISDKNQRILELEGDEIV